MIAYLDAGSGSMIVGVVAAGAAGVGVAVRSSLSRFRRKGKSADESPAEATGDETTVDDPAIDEPAT